MTSQTGKKKKAFTILETFIVLAIIAIVFVIGVPILSKFQKTRPLKMTSRNIANALRVARRYAISRNSGYGVKFDDVSTPKKYYIYYGVNTLMDKEYTLPAKVEFGDIDFNGTNQALFKPTGALDGASGSVVVKDKDEDLTLTISVENTTGKVNIE